MLQEVPLDGEIERDPRVGSAIGRLTNHRLPDVAEPLPVLLIGTQLAQDRGPELQQPATLDDAPLFGRMQAFNQRRDRSFSRSSCGGSNGSCRGR